MGTYFPMSNNPRDAATMLYLSDRLPNSNSETPVFAPNTITYNMNYNSSSMDLHPAPSESSSSQQEVLLNFGGVDQNQWKDNRNGILMMQGENSGVVHTGGPNSQGQGLSLSLGTNVPPVLQMSSIQYENSNFSPVLSHNALIHGENLNEDSFQAKQTRDSDYVLSSVPSNSNDVAQYGMPNIARGVANSKYLKAAQQLLDEVVNVKKDIIKDRNAKKELMKESKENEGELGNGGGSDPSVAPKADGDSTKELSVAEKQELQNKVTKLLSMLNEVDRRYRQYYHQMQIVVSSFDIIAGPGASKPYTALALQTISRHFRCLRDAITAQIIAVRKSLGEDDASSNDKGIGISRLRYVDQQLRQQRALQQLGIMQQHAWRPQRGLPETSVSVLRAWLFEHFLHPYPKDSEKIMLARQTGLSRSQVSNWFINARVRLWKPMVEEMYKEEAGDADMDSNSSSETAPRAEKSSTKDKGEDSQQATPSTGQLMESKPDQMTDIDIMGPDSISIFQNVMRAETQGNYGIVKAGEVQNSFFANAVVENPNCAGDRFISAYHISEFGNVSPVSLTLGLQRCEGDSLSLADSTNHGFNPMRDSVGYNDAALAMANGTADFDCLDSGNRTHQFVSSLLPSFT